MSNHYTSQLAETQKVNITSYFAKCSACENKKNTSSLINVHTFVQVQREMEDDMNERDSRIKELEEQVTYSLARHDANTCIAQRERRRAQSS